MTKKNEVVAKPVTALAMPEGGWDDGDFEAKDLLVPMICIGQGTSDIVKQGKAKPGDVYETVNKTILGDTKKALKFIPLKFFKTWVHCEMVKGRPQFRNVEPYTMANSGKYQYEEVSDAGTFRHYEVLNFYVLLEEDVLKNEAFPYLLSFRSSNKKKGRPLINHMAKARSFDPKKPICSMTFSLNTVLTSNGDNSWFVYDLVAAGVTPEASLAKSLEWLGSLNKMNHKIDVDGMKEDLEDGDTKEAAPVVKKGEVEKEARY